MVDNAPIATKITRIPAPGPVPNICPRLPANAPPGIIAGSNTLSASGPARAKAKGLMHHAIIRRIAKARPCMSIGTLRCQIAWLEAFTTGKIAIIVPRLIANTVTDGGRPMRHIVEQPSAPKPNTP
ncbi:MAG: hypothetical protein QOJ65_739 [Fimbriimonadaceae bacterium]|nr:hypothetical protein [Fimbriimonadaceae bacterium]